MGFKRPFDGEEFQGLPFKQSRAPCVDKLSHFVESVPCSNTFWKPDDLVEGAYGKNLETFDGNERFVDNGVSPVPNLAKDIDTNALLPLVSSTSSDEDVGFGEAGYSLFPEYFEHDCPRRLVSSLEDVNSSYLDRFPRKQVPLGPNHQAILPSWSGDVEKNCLEQIDLSDPSVHLLSGLDSCSYNGEKKPMGTCIIPMPDTESSVADGYEVGGGRKDCGCPDADSVRCVRQHIMEAREKLRKSIGHDKFVELGFYDMGEEVACQWSEEEERIFHAVVYSNPASLGRNFWKHLSEVFPTRSTKEIVSYYFNVFMLRRRASQNRSNMLDIDSDDDEWHGISRRSYEVSEEDEDSGVESPIDQCDEVEQVRDILSDDDDDNDDDSDDSDGDQVDMEDGSGDATGEDSGVDYGSESFETTVYDMSQVDPVTKLVDSKQTGSVEADFTAQEDSCMSFEFQTNGVDAGASFQVDGDNNAHGKCLPSESDGHSDAEGRVFLLDPRDSKLWDARFSSSVTGVDFLPTCNIIEEIFGQGTWDNQTINGHGIS